MQTNGSPQSAPRSDVSRSRARRWTVVLSLAALLTLAVAWDLSRPPLRQGTARLLLSGIGTYQAVLSPAMARLGVRCRFRPSCSRYAAVSIERYGALRGSWRAVTRIVRCGPWTPAGTHDPP